MTQKQLDELKAKQDKNANKRDLAQTALGKNATRKQQQDAEAELVRRFGKRGARKAITDEVVSAGGHKRRKAPRID